MRTINGLDCIFLQTDDISATLQQFTGDSPPSNATASSTSVEDVINNESDTQTLFRHRRSWKNQRTTADDATAVRNDQWLWSMKNVLWKNRSKRKSEPDFKTRRSSSSSSSSDRKGSITRQKRDDSSRIRHSRQTATETEGEDDTDEDYVDAELLNDPVNEFIRAYMTEVAKYWPMFFAADTKFQHVFQSVLTRTTIATNLNRTTLTGAGVPFKEFVVTCRYSAFYTLNLNVNFRMLICRLF